MTVNRPPRQPTPDTGPMKPWKWFPDVIQKDVMPANPAIMTMKVEQFPLDIMADLILQDIGGTELISIIRNDQVDGQYVVYKPIKDLELLRVEYNPMNITHPDQTLRSYLEMFSLDNFDEANIWLDTTGDERYIVIELEGLTTQVLEVAATYSPIYIVYPEV